MDESKTRGERTHSIIVDEDVSFVPTELTTVASEQLQEDVKKDLEQEDPEDKKALARLLDEGGHNDS